MLNFMGGKQMQGMEIYEKNFLGYDTLISDS